MTEQRNLRATRTGKVVSDKMSKTVVVAIERFVQHPLYQKGVKHTIKLKAHDENNEAHIGDTVQIMQTRPLSKDKCWRVIEIIERAK
ncbi:MAG: 30S ribosomal protein S17 [Acidaminococcaceae bacterium]